MVARLMQSKGGMTKLMVYVGVASALVIGSAALADALVVTDKEHLEAFAESVTGPVSSARVDAALKYVDPNETSVEVVAPTRAKLFDDTNSLELPAYAHQALAPLKGNSLQLIQRTVSIDGDDGLVAVRVRTSEGLVNATFKLTRRGKRWLVRRITISA